MHIFLIVCLLVVLGLASQFFRQHVPATTYRRFVAVLGTSRVPQAGVLSIEVEEFAQKLLRQFIRHVPENGMYVA